MKNLRKKSLYMIIVALIIVLISSSVIIAYAEETKNNEFYIGHSGMMGLGDICQSVNGNTQNNSNTAVTILTHGQNGRASNWSNTGDVFAYDSNSMIEKLRTNIEQANVYVAKNKEENIKLFKIHQNDYTTYDDDFDYCKSIDKLTEINKHSIIVFESSKLNTGKSHEVAYLELHRLIDKVLYDYKFNTGIVPKINLIGHSRGGLLNIMYASEHPQLVDSIFSLGTPYLGSEIGSLMDALGLSKLINSLNCDSARDIINPDMQNSIISDWEAAYAQNSNINAYALGGSMHINMMYEIIDVINEEFPNHAGYEILSGLLDLLVFKLDSLPIISNIQLDLDGLRVKLVEWLITQIAGVPTEKYDMQLSKLLDNFKLLCTAERWYEYLDHSKYSSIYEDDGMVHLDSQLAEGYSGFTRYAKLYDSDYNYKHRLSTGKVKAAHNYQSRDPELIRYITDRITLEKSDSIFQFQNKSGGLKLVGIKNNANLEETLEIPTEINGKLVVEIGHRALNNVGGRLDSIKNLSIPKTIGSIGPEAFNGLKLDTIDLNDNTNFKLVDDAIFSANMKQLVYYMANSARSEFVIPDTITMVEPFMFYNAKNLTSVTLSNNLLAIGNSAFANSGLTQISYNGNQITHMGHSAFDNTPYLEQNEFVVLNGTLLKYNGTQTIISDSTLPSNVTKIGYAAFLDSAAKEIDIPKRITIIDDYAFMSSGLESIIINGHVTQIGEGAFTNCADLEEVVLTFTNHEIIDYGAFSHNEKVMIKVPQRYIDNFINHDGLRSVAERITTKDTTIKFDTCGGNAVEDIKDVPYYSLLGKMPTPNKLGYDFVGWYKEGNESFFYAEGGLWDKHEDETVLMAKWSPTSYSIFYNLNGGMNANNPSNYNIEDTITLKDTSKKGFTFNGWFTDASFRNQISVINNLTGDLNLYAKFTPNTYTINLEANGDNVTVDTTPIKVTYGMSYTLPVPTRVGYTFNGWGNADGSSIYTNEFGASLKPWDFTQDTTVHANWSKKQFILKIIMENGILYYGIEGLTEKEVYVDFNTILVDFKASKYGYAHGKIFDYFTIDNEKISWKNNKVPDLGENGTEFILTPVWRLERHTIYFQTQIDNKHCSPISQEYGKSIKLPNLNATKTGYTQGGWWTFEKIDPNLDTLVNNIRYIESFDYTLMPDLTPITNINDEQDRLNCQNNGSIELVLRWVPNEYRITFDTVGGDKINDLIVEYDSKVYLPNAHKNYYSFNYWTFDGVKYSSGTKFTFTKPIKLVAVYKPTTYRITYEINGGTLPSAYPTTYTVESPTFDLPIPTKFAYRFNYWLLDGDAVSAISKGSHGNITLRASWKGIERQYRTAGDYTITDQVVIANFSKAGTLTRIKFYVADSVDEITFIGSTGVIMSYKSIIVNERTRPLTIRLKDVDIFGHHNMAAINAMNCEYLILESVGKNRLVSGTISDENNDLGALACLNVDIIGDELHIQGSHAFGTDNYDDGLMGGFGIFGGGTMNLSIRKLTVQGGLGSIGNSGHDGGNGGAAVLYLGEISIASHTTFTGTGGQGGFAYSGQGVVGEGGEGILAGTIKGKYTSIKGEDGIKLGES